jgi:SAM-dependent methyltransferase
MSNPNEWQEFFKDHAKVYDENVFTKGTAEEVEFLLETLDLPAGSTLLDVGCGTGRHAVALAQAGFKVTGVDLSDAMLDEARQRAAAAGVELTLHQSNITEYQPQAQHDAAICLCEGSLCLLGSADDPYTRDETVLRIIASALKPGAPFITTILNGCRLIREIGDTDVTSGRFDPVTMVERTEMEVESGEGQRKITVHERVYTPAEFVGMMQRAGFIVEHVWSGTAGGWKREPMKLDEMEFMVVARIGIRQSSS